MLLEKAVAEPAVAARTPGPPPVPVAAMAAAPAANSACLMASVNASASGGWLYLGRTNEQKSAWMPTENGSQSIQYDDGALMKEAPDLVKKLKDQCLSILTAKFLREEGEPGKRVNAKVKRAIPTGTRLRIVEVDDLGRDEKSQHKYPVVWARVVVLGE
jgi:hypothetical protein